MKIHLKQICMFAFFSFIAAMAMSGQSQAIDGNIDGYVRSQDGTELGEAHIRVSNMETGFTREADTNKDGYYIVQLLPPGAYSVSASKPGFSTSVRNSIALLVGQVVRVDVQLPVGNVRTVVEVTDEAPTVEVGRTATYSNVYTEREALNVPLSSRNPLEFYVFDPVLNSQRVSNGGSGTSTPTLSFGGYGTVLYNVDGVSNNIASSARNVVMSGDAISEYQTLVNYPAEFGGTAGPILNAISRSGTKDWHFSLYFLTKQKQLAARPFLLSPTAPTPEFQRYNYGATVSGPLIKDRVFFFLSYERWVQNLPVISTFGGSQQAQIAQELGISPSSIGTWTTTFRAHTGTAKVDIEVNQKNRLSLRYNIYNDRESPENAGQFTREDSTGYLDTPQSGTAQLVTTLSPSMLNELRFLYGFREVVNPVLHPFNPAVNISGIGTFNGNANGDYQYYESGYQIADNFTWNRGPNSFKMGFNLLPANYQDRTTNWNGTFSFSGLSANALRGAASPLQQYLDTVQGAIDPSTGLPYTYSQFSRSTGSLFYNATQFNTGYFAQDDLRLGPNLKLNFGLRYEFFGRPDGNLNPAYPQTGMIPQEWGEFAPRVGLAWDPFGNGKTVIRAGYGIYYNPAGPGNYDSWERQNGLTVKSITVLPTQAGAPAFTLGQVPSFTGGVAAVPNIYAVASNFKDGESQSYSAGVERELFNGFSLAVSYLGNHVTNLEYALPTNLTAVGQLADGRVLYGGTSNRPNASIGTVYSIQSSGTYQHYNAVLAVIKQRLSHGVTFQAGYQYQHIYGCLDRINPTVSGACFDQGVGSFNQPNHFTTTTVWEPRFNISNRVAASVLNGWLLSNTSMVQNGLPFNAVTGQDTNRDGSINDNPIGFGLNTFRAPLYVQIDFRATRKFQVGELGRVEVFAEALNSTNHENIYGVNTTWGLGTTPNASFGAATTAEIPRQWQMGIRYSY
jgi:hypothetical protein